MQLARWIKLRAPAASALAVCITLGAPGSLRAEVTQDNFLLRSTPDLIALCAASPSDPVYNAAVNFCQGFLVGVFRVLNEEDTARARRQLFCITQPAPTRNETTARFVQWANASAGNLPQQPADSFALFLSQQFPCTQGTPTRGARQ
jgi:hypothetical protein